MSLTQNLTDNIFVKVKDSVPQARSQVLRFGGKRHFIGVQDFCFCSNFITNFSVHKQGRRKDFFQGGSRGAKSGEIRLSPFESKKANFFCWNFQNPGGPWPPCPLLPTPMCTTQFGEALHPNGPRGYGNAQYKETCVPAQLSFKNLFRNKNPRQHFVMIMIRFIQ